MRWYSEQAVRVDGLARRAPAGTHHQLVLRRPVGPALLVAPWNFPIAMIARKVAPALAAGCTAVVKPAQLTPLTTAFVAEIVREELDARDLPTGVLNVVPTSSARNVSGPLLADARRCGAPLLERLVSRCERVERVLLVAVRHVEQDLGRGRVGHLERATGVRGSPGAADEDTRGDVRGDRGGQVRGRRRHRSSVARRRRAHPPDRATTALRTGPAGRARGRRGAPT